MALSGILTAVISIGLAMVLKGFVDIAAGASAMPLKQNIIAAVVILGLEGALSMVTTVSYRLSCARIARKMRLELSGRLYHSSLIEMQGHHVGEYMTNLTEDVEKVSGCFPDGATAKNVRPYVGLVPAANQVFCDTIAANICMAAKPDKRRLEACADMANIGRYVESLEAQYATMVGNGQKELSSGQEQRIGIARALYQKAQILLFDEPTANLDAESIDIFLDTLNQIAADRICIVVTHDPRVMQHCSMIYEVKNGGLAVCNGGAGA